MSGSDRKGPEARSGDSRSQIHTVETAGGRVYRFTEEPAPGDALELPSELSGDIRDLLRGFLNCHPDFVYVLDREHRFVFASPPLLTLWQRGLAEIRGKTFEELGYPPDLVRLHEAQLRIAFNGRMVRGENPFTSADGETQYYEYIFVPLTRGDESPSFVAGITRNVTRRTLLEQEREFLLSAIAHDLRTPLNAITVGASLLEETARDATGQALARRLGRNAARAAHMLSSLLDSARAQAGKRHDIDPRPMNLATTVQESVEELASLDYGPIEMRHEGPPEQYEGQWDEDAVRRIVENLVGNAQKYGDATRAVTVTLRRDGRDTIIDVHNWGEPIPADGVADLFGLFSRQAHEVPTARPRGWGVGLTVVSTLAHAHRGEVQLASSEEEGTTFTVTLPEAAPG